MRKITQQAVRAFYANEVFNSANTKVTTSGQGNVTCLWLHNSIIARIDNGLISINPQGYTTNTTKERLNGLNNVNIYQKDFSWYLNGNVMDVNNWTEVNLS